MELFEIFSNTFQEYNDFEIYDKSKTPRRGDIHLKFSKFVIMVDSKCFIDSEIPRKPREKSKHDMTQNSHIKIAWMISLHRPTMKISEFPFVVDIENGICIVYINSSLKYNNPCELLKAIWHKSNFVYDSLNREDDTILVEKWRKTETFAREVMQEMAVKSKEHHANLKLIENFHKTDKFVTDILNNEMTNIRTYHVDIIENRFKTIWKEEKEIT